MASILPVSSRALLASCERMGVDGPTLMERAGLSPQTLSAERMDSADADALWHQAVLATGDPGLGIRAAASLAGEDYPVLHYVGRNSARLGDALAKIVRYFDIVDPRVSLSWRDGTLSMAIPGLVGRVPRAPAEYTLGALVQCTRLTTGLHWLPTVVRLPFPRPPETSVHQALFQCPLVFDAERPEVVVPLEVARQPIPGADPVLGHMIDAHAAQLAEGVPRDDSVVGRASAGVAEVMTGHDPTAARVGRALGMSERTLHRRLKGEGHTFGAVVDAVRLTQAQVHLNDPNMSVAEVAWLLGFSEASALSRAFKRWTGQTPGQWRAGRGT